MEVENGIGSDYESYYCILGVSPEASSDDIRRAYRKLAMEWHPDKWANTPSLLTEAKCKFQKIQEAYSVLSDANKRSMYDCGLYNPTEEEDEGFCDFMQEMVLLMSQVKEEANSCSMKDLQSMFLELAQGFDSPQWFSSPSAVGNFGCSVTLQQQANPAISKTSSSDPTSSCFGGFGMSSYCR